MKSLCSRLLPALLLGFPVMSFSDPSPLEPYAWKHRLIVYDASGGELETLGETIERFEPGIADRDLLFLRLGEAPELPFHRKLEAKEQSRLRERFAKEWQREEGAEDEAVFLLVGKDGTLKDRQTGRLDLEEWFARIDAMPMRRREIQE